MEITTTMFILEILGTIAFSVSGALVSMIGALIFFILRTYMYRSLAMVISVVIIVIIRFISHRYKLSLPKVKF
jgi:uncharacterized membrane protein YeiH